ncbi:MAG: beta-ketoacyl-ACP synthase, partial [Lentisphaeraceae bacterium]|nr:beta-ketoacyl-ACP synthase [Lentisphaeraceae bacterium]
CSSGSKAIASASRLLATGVCDLVICGGVDTLCNLTLLGFDSLEVISENKCIPFSKNRDGINIGEAGALFLMTNQVAKLNLCGYGESSDAYHQSAPAPDGAGAQVAMEKALKSAEISPEKINYVNLHGTSTIQNDSMEAKAVNAVFKNGVAASSTKSLTGHTLGAAGAIEAAFSLLCIENNRVPVHHWDNEADENIADIKLIESSSANATVQRVMSNSYAFGGNNCSLIFGDNS